MAHPIEEESYAIMARRVDLSAWPDGARQVVARMIHATADESFASTARVGSDAVEAAVDALARRAPVICDARMVAAGIPSVANATRVLCSLDRIGPLDQTQTGDQTLTGPRDQAGRPGAPDQTGALDQAGRPGAPDQTGAPDQACRPGAPPAAKWATRSEAAIEMAANEYPDGALWVIGNAPTALARLLHLWESGSLRPAAVIGLPVGYVGAADAKAALWASPLARLSITNTGPRGGSPVAAAAVNALWRLTLSD